MNIKELNQQLKKQAIEHGLCQQWQDAWLPDSSHQILIDKFLRGIDFYLEQKFITKEQMKNWFSDEEALTNNIIIDKKRSILNPSNGIAIGESNVSIRCNGHNVCDFYATDNSHIHIVLRHACHLSITLCDNACIDDVEFLDPEARLYVCIASKDAHIKGIKTGDNIRISEQLQLYKPKKKNE